MKQEHLFMLTLMILNRNQIRIVKNMIILVL